MVESSQRYHFSDVTKIQALVKTYGWEICYTQVQPGHLEVETWETRIGDCLLYRERFKCHLVVHGTSTQDGFDVMLLQGGEAKFFGDVMSPKMVALFPPESDVDAVAFPGVETVHIQVSKERILAFAQELGVELIPPFRMRLFEPGVDRLARVRQAVERAIEILSREDHAAWNEVESDLLMTLTALFDRSIHLNHMRQDPADCPTNHALAVRQHIHSVDLDEVDIAKVADSIGVGRHHLNRCFKEHYGVSIQEFIHYRRLHAARDLLTQPKVDLTVTEAAYASGFHHLGRFSTEYHQLFGETPRETLQRAEQQD